MKSFYCFKFLNFVLIILNIHVCCVSDQRLWLGDKTKWFRSVNQAAIFALSCYGLFPRPKSFAIWPVYNVTHFPFLVLGKDWTSLCQNCFDIFFQLSLVLHHAIFPNFDILKKPRLTQLVTFFNFLSCGYPLFRNELLQLAHSVKEGHPFFSDICNLADIFEFYLPIVSKQFLLFVQVFLDFFYMWSFSGFVFFLEDQLCTKQVSLVVM